MKKLISLIVAMTIFSAVNAQSVEEIVKKYTAAMKYEQIVNIKTISITGKMAMMGMEIPISLKMKNPNKVLMSYDINGQKMVQAYDGEKGYIINPMTGSDAAEEISGDQLKQVQQNNLYTNVLADYFKSGSLTLDGEETVNGKSAFKLKVAKEGGSPTFISIDKESYLIVKTSSTVDQNGQEMNVESFPGNYSDINGIMLPKTTTMNANGMEMGSTTYDNVEVNIPIDDAVFKLK